MDENTKHVLNSYKEYWLKYVDFKGVTNRYDFWMTFLINYVITFALNFFYFLSTNTIFSYLFIFLSCIFAIATFIPNCSIAIRRLHDVGKGLKLFLTCSIISCISEIIFAIGFLTFFVVLICNILGTSPTMNINFGLCNTTSYIILFIMMFISGISFLISKIILIVFYCKKSISNNFKENTCL